MLTVRAKPWREKRGDRLVTFLFVVIVPLIIGFALFSHKDDKQPWSTVTARLLGTRIVAVAAEEHPFQSGSILYRVEAHVTYDQNGKHLNRWLPASGVKRDRGYLESWLTQKKRETCLVRWNPKNPSDSEAVLE